VAARLYLPAEWADDPARRSRAGVPEQVQFATKPELACQILAQLHAEGQLPGWLTGDEVYGNNPTLRTWCQAHDLGYVLGIPRSIMLTLGCGTTMRADQAVAMVDAHGWNYRSAGPDSKGDRDYAWAWIGTASPDHSLLVRRNLSDPIRSGVLLLLQPAGPATSNAGHPGARGRDALAGRGRLPHR
jgi:SRSO17 transposase